LNSCPSERLFVFAPLVATFKLLLVNLVISKMKDGINCDTIFRNG
jgi:hypothetical protein